MLYSEPWTNKLAIAFGTRVTYDISKKTKPEKIRGQSNYLYSAICCIDGTEYSKAEDKGTEQDAKNEAARMTMESDKYQDLLKKLEASESESTANKVPSLILLENTIGKDRVNYSPTSKKKIRQSGDLWSAKCYIDKTEYGEAKDKDTIRQATEAAADITIKSNAFADLLKKEGKTLSSGRRAKGTELPFTSQLPNCMLPSFALDQHHITLIVA
ncbi:hypothetical protein EW145_g8106 [Phellinidium pouzarii]|uniref:Uncharacterized protein n=1 Tax=Phellinidium pouzarii TaxID=167371 RepID=A0A4S4K9L5_9AGAM|nr:hypothetical protein EW145_g8106 [Phellinidium pouzarii]